MSDHDEGLKVLHQKIDAYLIDRRKYVVGFANFALEQGLKTKAPQRDGKPPETWRDVGRRLYGAELFEATLAAEVQARREALAQSRLPAVRGDKGKDAGAGQAAGGGKD